MQHPHANGILNAFHPFRCPSSNVEAPADIHHLPQHSCNFGAGNSATSTILICYDCLGGGWTSDDRKPQRSMPLGGNISGTLALVVYRTAVNIWPSPIDCQLATGTADIHVSKQTAKKQTSEHCRTPENLVPRQGILIKNNTSLTSSFIWDVVKKKKLSRQHGSPVNWDSKSQDASKHLERC